MSSDEAGMLRHLTDLRRNFLESLIDGRYGRIAKIMGDGPPVEFASVVNAVSCALTWKEGITKREVVAEKDKRHQFRVGKT